MTPAMRLARWPLQALMRSLHRLYLDALIRSAEGDLQWMQHQIDHAATLPAQMAVTRDHISQLRVRLLTGE